MNVSPFHYKHKYTGSQRGIELRKNTKEKLPKVADNAFHRPLFDYIFAHREKKKKIIKEDAMSQTLSVTHQRQFGQFSIKHQQRQPKLCHRV